MLKDFGSVWLKVEAEYSGYGTPLTSVSIRGMLCGSSSLNIMEGVKEFLKRKGKKLEGCTCNRLDFTIQILEPNSYREATSLVLPDGSTVRKTSLWMVYMGTEDKWRYFYYYNENGYNGTAIDKKDFDNRMKPLVEEVARANAVLRTAVDMAYEQEAKEKEKEQALA